MDPKWKEVINDLEVSTPDVDTVKLIWNAAVYALAKAEAFKYLRSGDWLISSYELHAKAKAHNYSVPWPSAKEVLGSLWAERARKENVALLVCGCVLDKKPGRVIRACGSAGHAYGRAVKLKASP